MEKQIDLFEHYELLPKKVQKVLSQFDEDNATYEECQKLVDALKLLGYICDYYLNAEPYNLRKIN